MHCRNTHDGQYCVNPQQTSANVDFNHKPVEVEMTFFSVVVARASRRSEETGCSCY